MAIDIACLAHFCQAVVLDDTVATTADYADHWSAATHLSTSPMSDFLTLVGLPESDSVSLLGKVACRAAEYADSAEFHAYIDMLADERFFGTFLRLSNGYFKTGFSDELLFGDIFENHKYIVRADRLFRQMRSKLNNSDIDPSVTEGADTQSYSWLEQMFDLFNEAESHLADYDSPSKYNDLHAHPLARLGLAPEIGAETAEAAIAVTKNLAATMYYAAVAQGMKASYLPHPVRAPLGAILSDELDSSETIDQQAIVRRLKFLRAIRARSINKRLADLGNSRFATHVDVELPFALAMVLEKCKCLDDFLGVLQDIREGKNATRFRKWLTEFRVSLQLEQTPIDHIEKLLNRLEDASARAMDVSQSGTGLSSRRGITVGINLGFLALEREITAPANLMTFRDLRLLWDFGRISNDTPVLVPLLQRVIGPAAANSWRTSQTLVASFTGAETRSLLDLRWYPGRQSEHDG